MDHQLDLIFRDESVLDEPFPKPPASPIYLISCVSQKLDRPAPAKELYCSDWFKKARAYVEALGGRWMIISALHGLVTPETVIEPYSRFLGDLTKREREVWACVVVEALAKHVRFDSDVIFLAGATYREAITDCWLFKSLHLRARAPMASLGIGEQKAWLARETRALLPNLAA